MARFINRVLFMLPRVHGDDKTQCLEIVAGRVAAIPNVFMEMKNKDLLATLAHR